ncbi:MAG: helix-turn-helix domain-containing protein [Bacteroidales bacterium]|nr:helix-turn-helix domain-containing protein [Bacteroidales bacterium]MCI2122153.1 helix-turn-helix domain-containing protein [Bacteroidales bacterium]MCI2146180.1 helix-turn-helix domain-containing protein [Bacteroidales bacterium]
MNKKRGININKYIPDKDELFDTLIYDSKVKVLNEAITSDYQKIPQFGAVALCTEGSAEFSIDTRSYFMKKNDMCIFFPHMALKASDRSKDLKVYIGLVNVDFFKNLLMPSSVPLYAYIRENPCMNLSDEELSTIMSMGELVKKEKEREDYIFRKEVVEKLLEATYYEIAAIYLKRNPIKGTDDSHCRTIFYKFITILENDYMESRMVSYYAEKMCMTPKYLSAVVKKASGKSANAWIDETIIVNSKILLKRKDLTVQQISDMMHFPNPSSFGQYFKRYVGITPHKYKNKE